MNEVEQVKALLRLVARAGGPLAQRDGLWVTPFRPAGRRHTKPWAVGADAGQLCLVVLADDGEAGRFPLAGSTLAEAATVLAETVWVHVGVELPLDDLVAPGSASQPPDPRELIGDSGGRFGGLDRAALANLAARLDAETVAAWVASDGAS